MVTYLQDADRIACWLLPRADEFQAIGLAQALHDDHVGAVDKGVPPEEVDLVKAGIVGVVVHVFAIVETVVDVVVHALVPKIVGVDVAHVFPLIEVVIDEHVVLLIAGGMRWL